MSEPGATGGALDRRLARLLRTLDAEPGFAARLGARLAREQARQDGAALDRARARALREHAASAAALRRGLRANLTLIAGAALAALGPAWLCGRVLGELLSRLPGDGVAWLAGASGALFLAWLGVVLARIGPAAQAVARRA